MSLLTNLFTYEKCDEASGTRADATGNTSGLAENGGAVSDTTGILINSAVFTGSATDYLHSTDSGYSIGAGDFTINFWVYLTTLLQNPFLVLGTGGAGDSYRVKYNGANVGDNSWSWLIADNSGNAPSVSTPFGTGLTVNTWAMITVWRDHSAGSPTVNICINNGTVYSATDTAGSLRTVSDFQVGNGVTGRIDEIGFWNRVLTSGEITSLYNSGAAFAYPFGGGGTTYTRSVSDNIALTDSVLRICSSLRLASDNIGVSDSVARKCSGFRLTSDNIGVSDSVSRKGASFRSTSDSVGISDSVSRYGPSLRAVSDNVAVSDAVARLASSSRSLSDLIAVADSVTRLATSKRSVSDNAGISDAVLRLASSLRLVSDFIAIGDSARAVDIPAGVLLILVSDLLGLSDSVSRRATSLRAVSDSVAVADAASRAATNYRLIFDSVAISDSARLVIAGALVLLVSDMIGLSTQSQRAVASYRLVSDSIGFVTTALAILGVIGGGGRRFHTSGRQDSDFTQTGRGSSTFTTGGDDGDVT